MGVDYGTRRVGIALSNEDGDMAFPYGVVQNQKTLLTDLVEIAKKEKVEAMVFGKSQTLGGEDNPVMEAGGGGAPPRLGELLNISVHFESEVFTTQEAIREQGRNEMTDAAAATIILNSYLMRIKNTV